MKAIFLLVSMLLLLGLTGGCAKKKDNLDQYDAPNLPLMKDIAILTMSDNLSKTTASHARELKNTLDLMNRDLAKNFKKSGFLTTLVKDMGDYKPEMGKLLVADVEGFNPGSRAAKAFVGKGAGSASLYLKFRLLDENGALLSEWRDGVGSSKGANHCTEILSSKAVENVIAALTI